MPEWRAHGAFLVYVQGEGSIGHGATLPQDQVFVRWVDNPDVEGFNTWRTFKEKLDQAFGDSYWIQWEGE